MTKNAAEFVTPLTFSTLSENIVNIDMFKEKFSGQNFEHISLAKWADCVVVVPATANIIAKITYGIADDLLSSTCLAIQVPLVIVPAMNMGMWNNSITQENIKKLQKRDVEILGPDFGVQACGDIGEGKMLEPIDVLEMLPRVFLKQILKNKRVVITAGPTIEEIDPVRIITNKSSGKMGYAIANAALNLGAETILISGKTNLKVPKGIKYIETSSSKDMYKNVKKELKNADMFISVAAVSDFCVKNKSKQKIKKSSKLILELEKNIDIISNVKKDGFKGLVVGFAAETEKLIENARKKLKNKKMDIIIANDISGKKVFGRCENEVTILNKKGYEKKLKLKSKEKLGYEILEEIQNFKKNKKN